MDNSKVFAMKFEKVYGCLIAKAERKGRTRADVDQVTSWLTGYSEADIESVLNDGTDYGTFFENAPNWNPDCVKIKGKICGVQIETIEDPIMYRIRCLDKLVDELAKGKSMDKILFRSSK